MAEYYRILVDTEEEFIDLINEIEKLLEGNKTYNSKRYYGDKNKRPTIKTIKGKYIVPLTRNKEIQKALTKLSRPFTKGDTKEIANNIELS